MCRRILFHHKIKGAVIFHLYVKKTNICRLNAMPFKYGTMAHSKKDAPRFYTVRDLNQADGDEAESEATLVSSLEGRRVNTRGRSGETFTAAVPGERAPMDSSARRDEVYNVFDASNKTDSNGVSKFDKLKNDRFKDAVNHTVMQRRSVGMIQAKLSESVKNLHKRSASSHVHQIMDLVKNERTAEQTGKSFAGSQDRADDRIDSVENIEGCKTHANRLVAGAFQVQKLFEDDDDQQSISSQTTTDSPFPIEELPLLQHMRDDGIDPIDVHDVLARRRKRKARKFVKMVHRKLRRFCRAFVNILSFCWQGIVTAYFAFAAIPLVMAAWILFYNLGNPGFDFLPTPTTLSWWLNFFARQLLTLELARTTQFLLIDGLTLRTKFTINVGGPLITLFMIQAKGWPFLLFAWGCVDLVILHGDEPFAINWLYWTGLRIFSPGVSGAYLINSDVYYHFLMCLILSGVTTSLKRTFMAVYFGRKTLGMSNVRNSLQFAHCSWFLYCS